jgi:hypothetical protein
VALITEPFILYPSLPESTLLRSLPFLSSAVAAYSSISSYDAHLHALQLKAFVHDALDKTEERDAVADVYERVEDEWEGEVKGLEGKVFRESLKEVWECARGVMEIGVGVSLGRV